MDMKQFVDFTPIKFLIVLGKMQSALREKLGQHLKDINLSETEFLILYAIAANGKLTIQDIGNRISTTSGNMTYTIDKLEKRQLLERIRCKEDRRKIYIDFTSEGQAFWNALMEPHSKYLTSLFEDIDGEVISKTIEYMKLIGKTLEAK